MSMNVIAAAICGVLLLMRSDDAQGEWQRIEDDGETIVYIPADGSRRSTRLEHRLPSGSKLISDDEEGLLIRIEMYEAFDRTAMKPAGAELTEEDVKLRHQRKEPFVVVRYQDFYNAESCVIRSKVRVVEEYASGGMINVTEFDHDVTPPEHLQGIHITEEFFVKD